MVGRGRLPVESSKVELVIEIFVGSDGQRYWRVKAKNGRILLVSEGYQTAAGARKGVNALARALGTDLATLSVRDLTLAK